MLLIKIICMRFKKYIKGVNQINKISYSQKRFKRYESTDR